MPLRPGLRRADRPPGQRRDLVLALGGGVAGDLAGFARRQLRRGVRFVQRRPPARPGRFLGRRQDRHQLPPRQEPRRCLPPAELVIADTASLDTLSPAEMRAGYAEVAKYGLIDSPEFFAWCEANLGEIFSGGPAREAAVAACCRAKAGVVVRDEREDGERALLRSRPHLRAPLERLTRYDSAGSSTARRWRSACASPSGSPPASAVPGQDPDRSPTTSRSPGLPTTLAQVPGGCGDADQLLDAMRQDKKVRDGALTFILARGIGRASSRRGSSGGGGEFLVAELG